MGASSVTGAQSVRGPNGEKTETREINVDQYAGRNLAEMRVPCCS